MSLSPDTPPTLVEGANEGKLLGHRAGPIDLSGRDIHGTYYVQPKQLVSRQTQGLNTLWVLLIIILLKKTS